MDAQLAQREVARLEAVVRSDGGDRAFPALCEAHRCSGRPEEAERIAREGLRRHPDQTAGRVALGLALLDLGRLDEARSELARVLDATPDHAVARAAIPEPGAAPTSQPELLDDIADGELEQAFASAEADRDEMMDANGVAAAVVRAVESEPEVEGAASADAAGSPFATHTMADLLENQGREEEAGRLRAALDAAPAENAPASESERVVRTLEGWLDNLRKRRR